MDLKTANLDDLLTGLSETGPAQTEVVPRWLESAGIYPGTTRVMSTALYDEFVSWCAANSGIVEKIPDIRQWGAEMTRRFKKERSNRGNRYYVSRAARPKIPENLIH